MYPPVSCCFYFSRVGLNENMNWPKFFIDKICVHYNNDFFCKVSKAKPSFLAEGPCFRKVAIFACLKLVLYAGGSSHLKCLNKILWRKATNLCPIFKDKNDVTCFKAKMLKVLSRSNRWSHFAVVWQAEIVNR